MSGFLNFIRDLIASIFTGDVKTSRLHRELKKVWHDLRQINPSFFRPHTSEILPAFAEAVFRFSRYARTLNGLFEKTILSGNGRTAELYRDHLVEAGLEEQDRLRKADFTYAAMKARLGQSLSFRETIAAITREFNEYLSLFRRPEFASCDEELAQLDRLAALSRFPYEKLLSFFDPGIAALDRGYRPSFVPVLARNLTQELMDFYFSIAELNIGRNAGENVVRLFRRYKKTPDREEEEKIRRIVALLESVREKQLSKETLLCLVRLAGEDPRLSLPADRVPGAYLELYKTRLLSRFELDREKLLHEHSETKVADDVSAFFKDTALLETRGYTEPLSRELENEGFQAFTHLQALRIMKTFVLQLYEKNIKEHLQRLVIEGFFERKAFKDTFIELFHETEGAAEKIDRLEKTLIEAGEVSVTRVREYLEKHRNGKTVSASLNQLVETMNDNVARLLEGIVSAFVRFNAAFEELLSDATQHAPTIVSNIHVIGGDRNPEIMKRFHADRDAISGWLRIMQHFTFIRESAPRPQAAPRRAAGAR